MNFLRYIVPALVVLSVVVHGAETQADHARPNIIFILADDLGYADLGCYGQTAYETPRIDQMAREGMRFTQHYSGSTVCAPSRACLLAGKHTGHVHLRSNGSYEFPADPQELTIGRLLSNAGYVTALIGKSGLSCNSDNGQFPNEKGFSHFFGYTSHKRAHRYYPEWLWRNGEKEFYPDNKETEGTEYSGDLFLADALEFLEKNAKNSFFLHLSLQQPHADLNVPQPWREPFLGRYKEKPFPGGHYRAEKYPKSTFAGMVTYLDHSVGQVIDKLHQLGIAENTLVIFSSDNGAMSEGGWSRWNFKSSGPLKGGKRDLYEGGIRVPTIAWWPGKISPGSSTDHISAFWDFPATACELAAIAPPADTDGISYVPTLLQKGEQPTHDYLYWEFYEQGGKQAVRQGKWKGVRLGVKKNPNAPLELYDLEADLGEKNNVAAQHPQVARRLEELISEAHSPSPIFSF
ncbi:MAG: arylsulfatase [Pirellulales bacterium]|nr:arylsulfatase [Pirellulales bacterium]